jgi:hypothetical protein
MLVSLVLSTALAAPPGYKVTKTADNDACELSLGPAGNDGVVPMHAECYWADVSIDKFNTKMAKYSDHDDYFQSVVTSDVRSTSGDRTLVWQQHHSSGISDREVLLWMKHSVENGFDRYGWTLATEQKLDVQSGHVAADRDDGWWEAKADPKGGIRVIHELNYGPGGSVPGFIVRAFQSGGLQTNVEDLHAALKK